MHLLEVSCASYTGAGQKGLKSVCLEAEATPATVGHPWCSVHDAHGAWVEILVDPAVEPHSTKAFCQNPGILEDFQDPRV